MTRKWTYVFAVVLLALMAVTIYAAVYIPGLQRAIKNDTEAMGRLSVVTIKLMPDNLTDMPIEFKYNQAIRDSGAMVEYAVTANPEAQSEIGQAIMNQLEDVHSSPTQITGEFVDGGYAYTVLINPTDTRTTIVVVDNGLANQ